MVNLLSHSSEHNNFKLKMSHPSNDLAEFGLTGNYDYRLKKGQYLVEPDKKIPSKF